VLKAQDVDALLEQWRQGDCVVGEQWFLFQFSPSLPLTQASKDAAEEAPETEVAEAQVLGFVVLTQTCDLARSCEGRPFIEVAPLVEKGEHLQEIKRGRRPQFAFIPGLEEEGLVGDLDRVMTVEKSLVAGWERVEGCLNDGDVRRFALALARKRARFAFPDDFVAYVSKLRQRLQSKHDKGSEEGQALRALREIRVRAAPSWDADGVEVTFFFIRDEEQVMFNGKSWDEWMESWLSRLPESSRFRDVGFVVCLEDLTAKEYVESDPLDLDHLSERWG